VCRLAGHGAIRRMGAGKHQHMQASEPGKPNRGPQSTQSSPRAQAASWEPGPPSLQMPSRDRWRQPSEHVD
jgi:hypothetical protein